MAALAMGLPGPVEADGQFSPGLHAEVALKVFTGLDTISESGLSTDAYCASLLYIIARAFLTL